MTVQIIKSLVGDDEGSFFITPVLFRHESYIFYELAEEETSWKIMGSFKPFPIPPTHARCYISFKHALNLRYPDEDTGGWHFLSAFFYPEDQDLSDFRPIPRAGEGCEVNTNPRLGTTGVREMSQILEKQTIRPASETVYVANHYRAIADIAMLQLSRHKIPTIANNRSINQWLDTEQQVSTLLQHYLYPLHRQLNGLSLDCYQQWIKTVRYE